MVTEAAIQAARAIPIEDEIARRGIVLKGKTDRCGPCPVCGGVDRFSINTVKQVFNCRGCTKGGDVITLVRHLDQCGFIEAVNTLNNNFNGFEEELDPFEKMKARGRTNLNSGKDRPHCGANGEAQPRVVAEYVYELSDGTPYLKVIKLDPKDFKQQHWNGSAWAWGKPGGDPIPYRLSDLIKSSGEVFVCEGEGDVDRLAALGLVATTNAGGASNWVPEFRKWFNEWMMVYILEDNDGPGRKRSHDVARSLSGTAGSVRVISLPGLPEKGDVSDWLEAGGTRETLLELCRSAPEWDPGADDRQNEKSTQIIPLTIDEWLSRELPEQEMLLGEWLTKTTRAMMVAGTGLGKTNFAMQIGMHMAAGANFLHWSGHRKSNVLYIDGEMSRRLLKQRIMDCVDRLGSKPEGFHALSHEDIEGFSPLNTPEGQACIESVINRIGGVDFIIFDSVMCLTIGDMKDEESWQQTLPWARSLTRRNIGQLWVHHTGHDSTRSYGTKTREWQLDLVAVLEAVDRDDCDVSFQLEFSKARERTPDNRADFKTIKIWLSDNWEYNDKETCTSMGKVSPIGRKFLDALRNATIHSRVNKQHGLPTASYDEWKEECIHMGLIDQDAKPDSARSMISQYRRELVGSGRIACDGGLRVAWTL